MANKSKEKVYTFFAQLCKLASDYFLKLTVEDGVDEDIATMLTVAGLTEIVIKKMPTYDSIVHEKFVQKVIDNIGL